MAKKIMDDEDEYIILISGAIGSGKTSFLSVLEKELDDNYAGRIISCGAFSRIYNSINAKDELYDSLFGMKYLGTPVLIDDIELINNPNELILQLRNHGQKKIIATSRNRNAPSEISFTHIITLHPLSFKQFQQLFYKNAIDSNLIEEKHASLLDKYAHYLFEQTTNLTPRDVLKSLIDFGKMSENTKLIDDVFLKNRHLLYQYGEGIDLSNKIIIPQKQIITPPKDIVTEVTVLDKNLLDHIKRNPATITSLSPREFEELVCDLLNAQGYLVELTQQTRDGGKDIIVTQKSHLGDFCIYVECKRYDRSNPVRVKLIRELYGTVMADNVTAGLMVTTSYYTKDAYEYRETVKNRIKLKDYQDLVCDISKLQ